ncbi:tRNA (adenosine(37)-N6)-threonylcarbamoyltransferase complex dimerization subunit type 1 TsaB [Calditerrivibrio sp.]|uniref:tRNA (adenosine(37)-N6)-threonylcarbamoyltransferase complex dimerization subunit type 1 TsaB n=1 Tax=Calditerrivibrio sp. TaxID=2792612 RepID=UPI003D14207B
MVRLLLDTTSQYVSLAISKDQNIIFKVFLNAANRISEKLIDIIEQSLNIASLQLKNIDEFIVVTGPGSFTGIRVGVSVAQGVAVSISKPVYGISILDAFALADDKKTKKIALKLRGKEYVCKEYDFTKMVFSDYYTIYENEITNDIDFIMYHNIYSCLTNKMLENFKTEPIPFYFKKSEAEIQFDKKSC